MCLDCDSGINKLSGSFSTSFSARSKLVFFAINGNLGMVRLSTICPMLTAFPIQDWDLSVFGQCATIAFVLMQVPQWTIALSKLVALRTGLWNSWYSTLNAF